MIMKTEKRNNHGSRLLEFVNHPSLGAVFGAETFDDALALLRFGAQTRGLGAQGFKLCKCREGFIPNTARNTRSSTSSCSAAAATATAAAAAASDGAASDAAAANTDGVASVEKDIIVISEIAFTSNVNPVILHSEISEHIPATRLAG